MRTDIVFDAEGTTLRGWLFMPAGAGPHPIIVMAHGFSGLKEQYLDRFAAVFAEAGLASLVFDNRNFGASGGEPRQEIDPVQQIRDYRHAITFARGLPDIDRERVGVWGTSYSGGHGLVLGAIDRRVRCVAVQVPTISGSANALRRTRPDLLDAGRARFDADREARYRGEPPAMVPVVSQDRTALCALSGEEAYGFFQGTLKVAPHRRNEVTLRSLEMAREYEPGFYMERISPTPLLMIVATRDPTTPTDLCLAAYNRALEPKKLVLIEGGHFTPYVDAFEQSSSAARDWFVQHLLPAGAPRLAGC
jgi:fermentation-respiration switch protein FrsA (DUF1100 family)